MFILCLTLILLLSGCRKSPETPKTLTEAVVGGKNITLVPKDELSADAWNDPEVTYNEKSYRKYPVLYKGITIGSKAEDVIESFDIKAGYAMVDREIDTSGDGCTDIVREEYKNMDFFEQEKVLDANFIFGYELENGEWNAITYKELQKISKNPDSVSDVLLYQTDICGSQMEGEKVDPGCVIQFSVSYL